MCMRDPEDCAYCEDKTADQKDIEEDFYEIIDENVLYPEEREWRRMFHAEGLMPERMRLDDH